MARWDCQKSQFNLPKDKQRFSNKAISAMFNSKKEVHVLPVSLDSVLVSSASPVTCTLGSSFDSHHLKDVEEELKVVFPSAPSIYFRGNVILFPSKGHLAAFEELLKTGTTPTSSINVDVLTRIYKDEPLDIGFKYDYKPAKRHQVTQSYRYQFMAKLLSNEFCLIIKGLSDHKKRQVFAACPLDKIYLHAEHINYKTPLTREQIQNEIHGFESRLPLVKTSVNLFSISSKLKYKVASKRSAPFMKARADEYMPFTSSQRLFLVQSIISSIDVETDPNYAAPKIDDSQFDGDKTPDAIKKSFPSLVTALAISPKDDELSIIDLKRKWKMSDFIFKGLIYEYHPLHTSELSALRAKPKLDYIRDYFGTC